jgi:hypothetical protein
MTAQRLRLPVYAKMAYLRTACVCTAATITAGTAFTSSSSCFLSQFCLQLAQCCQTTAATAAAVSPYCSRWCHCLCNSCSMHNSICKVAVSRCTYQCANVETTQLYTQMSTSHVSNFESYIRDDATLQSVSHKALLTYSYFARSQSQSHVYRH